MANVVEQAFEAMCKLTPERRDELARYVLQLAINDDQPEDIDPAHLPAVLEGLGQAASGQFASPERIEAAFRSFNK